MRKITENLGDSLLKAPIYPCLSSAPTTTPSNGKPIPVKQKLKLLARNRHHFLCPKLGGKIRLPAPKT